MTGARSPQKAGDWCRVTHPDGTRGNGSAAAVQWHSAVPSEAQLAKEEGADLDRRSPGRTGSWAGGRTSPPTPPLSIQRSGTRLDPSSATTCRWQWWHTRTFRAAPECRRGSWSRRFRAGCTTCCASALPRESTKHVTADCWGGDPVQIFPANLSRHREEPSPFVPADAYTKGFVLAARAAISLGGEVRVRVDRLR
jgi:hypothetical protein